LYFQAVLAYLLLRFAARLQDILAVALRDPRFVAPIR